MSNSEAAGNESSSSNPLPPPAQESPLCRRRGGEFAPPHGRGSYPVHPWEMALFTPPRPRAPPIMGAPGTAFEPYRPPRPQWPSPGTAFEPYRPPPPQWPSPGTAFEPYRSPPPQRPSPSSGHATSGSSQFRGFHTAPIKAGGGGVAAAGGGIQIGGNLSGRKRAREGSAGGGGGGNGAGDGIVQHCSVCNKGFGSSKALFGHMRSHPDRGWKGVHPPPSFRAEEEFADLRAAAAAAAAAVEAEAESAGKEAEDEADYRVPDLNHPPPPDSN